MSKEKRSALMSRIKGRDTKPELIVARALNRHGLRPKRHDNRLPGRPDFVFVRAKVAVFVDGDFWHGWRFPAWEHKLTPFWHEKIAANKARDQRINRKLRKAGWTVIRVWEHQIQRDLEGCIERIVRPIETWRRTRTIRMNNSL